MNRYLSIPVLSIIIPFYNESNTLEPLVNRVLTVFPSSTDIEIILVDDASTDKSYQIAKKIAQNHSNIKLIKHSTNNGKSVAIRTGLEAVEGKFVLIQDADLEYSPEDIPSLLGGVEQGILAVYGSRNFKKHQHSYFYYYLGGVFLSFLCNLLYRSNITDIATGYKLIQTDLLKSLNLEENGFNFCYEVTAKMLRKGIKIKEISISYHPRRREEGKKIKFSDGIKAILTLFKYRFKK